MVTGDDAEGGKESWFFFLMQNVILPYLDRFPQMDIQTYTDRQWTDKDTW